LVYTNQAEQINNTLNQFYNVVNELIKYFIQIYLQILKSNP